MRVTMWLVLGLEIALIAPVSRSQPPEFFYGPYIGGPFLSDGYAGGLYNSFYGGGPAPLYPPYPLAVPRSILVSSQVVASPPLPPAKVIFSHLRNETLHVEVYDRKQQRPVFNGEISPGQPVELTLPRDAGGYVNKTYQSVGPFGDVVQRNVTRTLPIDIRYEVTVHRWHVQSIAIDRTGKSPSPIEDINYQGQALGKFALAAGPKLIDGQIDVFRAAVAAGNQGALAPLQTPTTDDGPASDPLRQVLEELRSR